MLEQELRALAHALRGRRRWRLAIRSLWLVLAWVAAGVILRLIGYDLGWALILIPALVGWLAGAAYGWFSNPSLAELTRAYDRHYDLKQRLATALETAQQHRSGVVVGRLVDDALILVRRLRRDISAQPIVPWREWELVGVLALVLGAVWVVNGQALPPAARTQSLPVLPTPVAPTATPPPAPEQPVAATPPPLPPEQQAAADAIADALRDQGATKPAADALDQGDPQGAAEALRALGEQADQLSEQARQDLAEELRQAAEELRPTQPELAEQLEGVAEQMEQNPGDAMRDLAAQLDGLDDPQPQTAQADATAAPGEQPGEQPGTAGEQPGEQPGAAGEQPGEQPGPSGQGASPGGAGQGLGGESRTNLPAPPEAAGEAVPLPTPSSNDGPMTSATGPEGPSVELPGGGTGSGPNQGGGGSANAIQGEADPLSIPAEDRELVENYFTP